MVRQYILFFIIAFFTIVELHSQQDIWKNYTNTNRITSLVRDSTYIWIGTTGGLIKYNTTTGEKSLFNKSTIGFPGNFITSLKLQDNVLWVGTKNGGFGKFNGQSWVSLNIEKLRFTC